MNTRNLVVNAIIAAVYAALTIALAPISYGPIQVRLSEFMTLAAFYNQRYVPGLTIGCLLANLYSPFGIIDMVIGTFATFIAVYTMRWAPNIYVAALFPVISNGLLIGAELAYMGALPDGMSTAAMMLYIAAGEFVAVGIFGIIIWKLMERTNILQQTV